MGTYWEDEVRKALHMELVEQRDRQLRDMRNAYRVTDARRLGCICGACSVERVTTFTGQTALEYLEGPCALRPAKPLPGMTTRHGSDRVNGVTGTERIPLDDPRHGRVDLDNIYNSSDTAATDVELWRSLWFGWHGRLYAGHSTIDRWWRPFRRFAEYRGSYVLLRYLEHRDREPLDLAGY